MGATIAIVLLWIGFGGSHIALSVLSIRDQLVRRLGEWPFRGLYSLVSLAFFIPLVWVYAAHKHAGPQLWHLSHGVALLLLMYVGMAVAFTLLVAAFVRPSPAAVVPVTPHPRASSASRGTRCSWASRCSRCCICCPTAAPPTWRFLAGSSPSC